jgi:hypothetical protein
MSVLYLIATPLPFFGLNTAPNIGSNAAHFYGITSIDVFNKTDLKMAENWFVLESADFKEPVPLFTDEGTRLFMHKSDRIYFGYTLRFRRGIIGTNECQFEPWKEKITYLSKVYLHLKSADHGLYTFTYKQMFLALPNWDYLVKNIYIMNKSVNRCTVKYTVNLKE